MTKDEIRELRAELYANADAHRAMGAPLYAGWPGLLRKAADVIGEFLGDGDLVIYRPSSL